MIRIRLSLLLEQAKNALLLRQGAVYEKALEDASNLVAAHFRAEDSVTVAVLDGLADLGATDIEPALPDIAASQQAIRAFIDKTYQSRNQVDPLDEEVSP